jgi:hypothetical protein
LIYFLLLTSVVMVLAFWLRPAKQTVLQTPTPQEAAQPASNAPVIVNDGTKNVSSQPPVSTLPENPKVESEQEKTERLVREANAPYETPIRFYGRVIDQDSNSLAGVKINSSVYHEHLFMPTASGDSQVSNDLIHPQRETDSDGRFEITGEKGRNVTIESVLKDGYEVEPDCCPQTFGASGGAFENPVIFKMWSTNIHEQLITSSKSFQIVPDGKAYFINLTDDTISQSGEGDLKVWIQYTNQPVRGQLYDWSAEIDVVNGGLLEESLGSSMFEAPTDGYVPSFVWKSQIKGGQRGNIGDRQFYLLLKNGGEYGQMSINLHAPFNNQTPGLIRLSYAINPSGSHILR